MLVLGAAARNVPTGLLVVAAPCLALACAVVAGLTGSLPTVIAVAAVVFVAAVAAVVARDIARAFARAQRAYNRAHGIDDATFAFKDYVAVFVAIFISVTALVFFAIFTAVAFAPFAAAFGAFAVGGAAFAAAIAALLVFFGIRENWRGGFRAVFADPLFKTGFDILAVMLGALFVASWFANPPIW